MECAIDRSLEEGKCQRRKGALPGVLLEPYCHTNDVYYYLTGKTPVPVSCEVHSVGLDGYFNLYRDLLKISFMNNDVTLSNVCK